MGAEGGLGSPVLPVVKLMRAGSRPCGGGIAERGGVFGMEEGSGGELVRNGTNFGGEETEEVGASTADESSWWMETTGATQGGNAGAWVEEYGDESGAKGGGEGEIEISGDGKKDEDGITGSSRRRGRSRRHGR